MIPGLQELPTSGSGAWWCWSMKSPDCVNHYLLLILTQGQVCNIRHVPILGLKYFFLPQSRVKSGWRYLQALGSTLLSTKSKDLSLIPGIAIVKEDN